MATALVTQGLTFPDGTSQTSYYEVSRGLTSSNPNTTINLTSGDTATFFKMNVASSTTLTFTNPPALSNQVFAFTLMTVNTGAGYVITWGNAIKWAGGTPPPRTTTNGAVDVWSFFIENGTYYGSLSMANAG